MFSLKFECILLYEHGDLTLIYPSTQKESLYVFCRASGREALSAWWQQKLKWIWCNAGSLFSCFFFFFLFFSQESLKARGCFDTDPGWISVVLPLLRFTFDGGSCICLFFQETNWVCSIFKKINACLRWEVTLGTPDPILNQLSYIQTPIQYSRNWMQVCAESWL